MTRLKTLLATLPFLFTGTEAFLPAEMSTILSEPTRLPIAYTSGELYVMDILSGDILFEANNPELDCPSSIAPDGNWLIYFSGSSPREPQHYLVELSTGRQITLAHKFRRFAGWDNEDFNYFHTPEPQGEATLYHFDSETARTQPLMTFSEPPDSISWRWVENDLYYLKLEANQLTVYRNAEPYKDFDLPEGHISKSKFSVSFDARYIYFVWREEMYNSPTVIYVLDVQTGAYITLDSNWAGYRHWKPSSNSLLYIDTNGDIAIYNAETQESEHFELTSISSHVSYSLWSPDERYVAYRVYHPGGTKATSYSLHILNPVTGETVRMAGYVSEFAGRMRWVSPSQLVYTYADADYIQTNSGRGPANADLWVYDMATKERTQLTATPNEDEDFGCIFG